jgi:hypothetical protein
MTSRRPPAAEPSSPEGPRSLAEDLRGRPDEALLGLLVGRPDLAVPLPSDLGQLAARATTSASTLRALDRLDRWHLQVLETAVVCARHDDSSSSATVDEIAALLPDASSTALADAIDRLFGLALLWGSGDSLRPTTAVREAFSPDPGGLGPFASTLDRSVPTDLDALVQNAPAAARGALDALTWGPPRGSVARADRVVSARDATDDSPISWLLAHGLLVAIDDATVVLPAEIGLSLRGGRLFEAAPVAPELVGAANDAARVDAAAAGSAFDLVRRVEDLLELWSYDPPAVLRSGGVGLRDVKTAARALDVTESELSLLAELALQTGLLARDGEADEAWLPTNGYDLWRLAPVASRWVELALAWLGSTRVIGLLGQRDERDQRRTPLAGDLDRVLAPEVRRAVLADLDAVGPGVAVAPDLVVARESWRRPRRGNTTRAGGRDAIVRWALAEAAQLGVTGLGALASFAAPLIAPHDAAAGDAADRLAPLLPRPVDHVLLQADLTAVAPGPLEGTVARELGLMADVESTGGATVYRFTADSIRRALDAGRTTSELHAFVATHSRTPVPQPLEYLIDDVARRHGRLRIGSASAYLRSDDPGVLDELMVDRRSDLLRLRRIAPTVAVAQAPPDVVLDRVRAMNLAPVAESADGGLLLRRPDARRTGQAQRPPRLVADPPVPRVDVLAAAIRALRAGDRGVSRGVTVAGPAGSDTPPRTAAADTVAALRAAVEEHRSVWLGYVDDDGGVVERVVDPLEVRGGWLTAFDHRYEAVRTFRVHRISGVAPLTP